MQNSDGADKQHFVLGDFEGPLDLLLFLIKKSEINIYDIPISKITEQYLEYLSYATKINLENISEFYLMASTLLYIKSRMLLPHQIDVDAELEDPRKELVEKLIEYQKIKKLTDLMVKKERENEWLLERKQKERFLPFDDDGMWEELEVWEIVKAFSRIISSLSADKIIDLFEEVSVNEKLSLINEFVEKKNSFLFTELIKNRNSLMDVICTFLALLEAVKQQIVTIYQNKLFGDIKICANQHVEN